MICDKWSYKKVYDPSLSCKSTWKFLPNIKDLDNLNLCINGVSIKEKWRYETEENESLANDTKRSYLNKLVNNSESMQVEGNDEEKQEIEEVKKGELINEWIREPIHLDINSSFVIDEGYDRHRFNLVRVYLNDEELQSKWTFDPRIDVNVSFAPRIYGPRSQTLTKHVMLIIYIYIYIYAVKIVLS